MDETANSRTSDAAASRKRRSSILKSHRPARAPLSELEFNVATPTDTAKSRRVSFSRRTGVAEFATNEATTTWKNFYEEHNRTLESSGNETGANPPRASVGQLGKRIFDQQFQEVAAVDFLTNIDDDRQCSSNMVLIEPLEGEELPAPQRKFDLSSFTEQRSKLFSDDLAISGIGEVTDQISLNFTKNTNVVDDLEDIEKDLKRVSENVKMVGPSNYRNGQDMSEYIEIDLNMTHVRLRNDESDMSITDTVLAPKVDDSQSYLQLDKKDSKNWAIDKENIAVNPYVAPKETANFAVNTEPDKVLVFDGKRLVLETETQKDLVVKKSSKEIVLNIDDDLPNFVDDPLTSVSRISKSMNKSMFGDDMSITEPLDVNDKQNTINFGEKTGNISTTQALPSNIVMSSSQTNRTMHLDISAGNISMTQALPSNIVISSGQTNQSMNLDISTGNISMTQALPSNIVMSSGQTNRSMNLDISTGNISMTQALPSNIVMTNSQTNQTMSLDISTTQAVCNNLILPGQDKRKTIIYDSNDGNLSMTQACPNVVINQSKNEVNKEKPTDEDTLSVNSTKLPKTKRITIVFDPDDADISTTQALPNNIILSNKNSDKSQTIVFDEEVADISMTQVVPTKPLQEYPPEKRKTIVFDSEDADISMTQAIPNIILNNGSEKRKTIVFGNDDGDISMTQSIHAHIIPGNDEDTRITASKPNLVDKTPSLLSKNESAVHDVSLTETVPTNVVPCNENSVSYHSITKGKELNVVVATNSDKSVLNKVEMETSDHKKTIVIETNVSTDASFVKLSTKISDKRQTIVEESVDISNTSNMENVKNVISMKTSDNVSDISSRRHSQEMEISITEFNDEVPNEPLVAIHNKSLNKLYTAEEIAHLSLTKPIPADLMIIQKILDKSNAKLYNIGEEREHRHEVLVYQANAKKTVVPTLPAFIRTEFKENANKTPGASSSVSHNLSETDLQHNRANTELVKPPKSVSQSLEESLMPQSTVSSYKDSVSNISSSKSKLSRPLPPKLEQDNISNKTDVLKPPTEVSNSNKQLKDDSYTIEESGIKSKEDSFTVQESGNKFQEESMEESAEQLESKPTEVSKKNLLHDLLDMSQASVFSGLVDQGTTAKIETAEPSKESLFYITRDSEDEAVDEVKNLRPIVVGQARTRSPSKSPVKSPIQKSPKKASPVPSAPKSPDSLMNNPNWHRRSPDTSIDESQRKKSPNRSRLSMMQYIQEKLSQVKEQIKPNRLFEKTTHESPEIKTVNKSFNEANTTRELLDMLANFTDKEERNNPLNEDTSTEDGKETKKMEPLAIEYTEDVELIPQNNSVAPIKNIEHLMPKTASKVSVARVSPRVSFIDSNESVIKIDDKFNSKGIDPNAKEAKLSNENLEPRRLSLATRRQSVVLSKEDLMNNISLAQQMLQTMDDSTASAPAEDLDSSKDKSHNSMEEHALDGDSFDNKVERKQLRSSEVVKSLRFEDEDSGLKDSPLKKTAFGETSYMVEKRTDKSHVIPSYLKDVSDGIKQLMSDLVKPSGDVMPFESALIEKDVKRVPSTASTQIQANLVASSQIDVHAGSREMSPRASMSKKRSIIKSNSPSIASNDHSNSSEQVIVFDPNNPLNNILVRPRNFSNAHRYEPLTSENLAPKSQVSFKEGSSDRVSAQFNVHTYSRFGRDSDLAKIPEMVSQTSVDRGVDAPEYNIKDSTVNTLISMRTKSELLQDSSLTLVDEAGDNDSKCIATRNSSPSKISSQVSFVEVIYKQDKDVFRDASPEPVEPSKRKYSPIKHSVSNTELTPKPKSKILRRSASPVSSKHREDTLKDRPRTTDLSQLKESPNKSRRHSNRSTISNNSKHSTRYSKGGSASPDRKMEKSPDGKRRSEQSPNSITERLNKVNESLKKSDLSSPDKKAIKKSDKSPRRSNLSDKGSITKSERNRISDKESYRKSGKSPSFDKKSPRSGSFDKESVKKSDNSSRKSDFCDKASVKTKLSKSKKRKNSFNDSNSSSSKRSDGSSRRRSVKKSPSPDPQAIPQGTTIMVQQMITEVCIETTIKRDEDSPMYDVIEDEPVRCVREPSVQDYRLTARSSASSKFGGLTPSMSVTTYEQRTGVTMDWTPELINELSSKNLIADDIMDVNVAKKIDMLPFMGSIECQWESATADTWSFLLLHGRLRLRVQLALPVTTSAASMVSAGVKRNTPVSQITIENLHHDKRNQVAVTCVRFAADALRYLTSRSDACPCAGDVPALLRRAAGVARVALRWGRAMHDAWTHLAYTMSEDGVLSLKVANLPLRSVWEVTLRPELVIEDAREVPWPRAGSVHVACVLSDHPITQEEVQRLLNNVRKDWGHVPRCLWKIFRHLKYRTKDGDPLLCM